MKRSDLSPVPVFGGAVLWGILLWYALSPSCALATMPLGFPGSTWGTLRFPSSQDVQEKDNLILEGAIEQGIDWFELGEWSVVNTFMQVSYAVDQEKFDYNNEIEFEVGLKLKILSLDWMCLEFGGKYILDYRWETDRHTKGTEVFLNWGASWDLMDP